MADTPLSAEEFQREFTLNLALSALRATPEGNPWRDAAEDWIRHHVADLETKAEVAARVVRVAVTEVKQGDALVFTLRDATGMDYADYLHCLDALKQLVARELGHPVPVLLVDGADVSVLRTVQDAGRCLLGFPSSNGKFVCRCTLPACHDGQHDNGNGDTWPESEPTQIKEDEPGSLFSTGGTGQPAPEHLSEGRLPKRDLATGELLEQECAVAPIAGADPADWCARERGHTGPHMDRTAIAHAGKAGEVWG